VTKEEEQILAVMKSGRNAILTILFSLYYTYGWDISSEYSIDGLDARLQDMAKRGYVEKTGKNMWVKKT